MGASTDAVVQVQQLSRRFGELVAVRDLSFQVNRGEIFGILGPNGAGKSTILRMLCGILDPSSGSGQVVGFDILRQAEKVKQRIGYMTQRFSLYEDLKVGENLRFYAGLYGVPRSKKADRIAEVMRRAAGEYALRRLEAEACPGLLDHSPTRTALS